MSGDVKVTCLVPPLSCAMRRPAEAHSVPSSLGPLLGLAPYRPPPPDRCPLEANACPSSHPGCRHSSVAGRPPALAALRWPSHAPRKAFSP